MREPPVCAAGTLSWLREDLPKLGIDPFEVIRAASRSTRSTRDSLRGISGDRSKLYGL